MAGKPDSVPERAMASLNAAVNRMENRTEVHLRPHHLLCIQKFTGHGYDAAFTAFMTALTGLLRSQPQTRITLVQGADDLCAHCPHLCGGVCDAAKKTAALDAAVLQACKLAPDTADTWQTLSVCAYSIILQSQEFHKICARCQWYALCKITEVLKNDTN